MPQWIEDCVESVRPRLKKKYPNASGDEITSRAYAICNAAYKKRKGNREGIDIDMFNKDSEDSVREALCNEVFYWQSKMTVCESLTEALQTLDGEKILSDDARALLQELQEEEMIVEVKTEIDNHMLSNVVSSSSSSSSSDSNDSDDSDNNPIVFAISSGYNTTGSHIGMVESGSGSGSGSGSKPKESPHVFIAGAAIHTGTTRNMNHYRASELEKAAPSLVGKSIQVDHSHRTIDNVGKVIAASFDRNTGTLKYVGRLQKGEKVTEKVLVGDVDTVSIGAVAKHIVFGILRQSRIIRPSRTRPCGHIPGGEYDGEIATNVGIGIDFVELSLTPVPADPRASALAVTHDSIESALFALAESFHIGDRNMVSEEETRTLEMMEALKSKNEQLEAALRQAELREKQMIASGIAGAEIRLGLLTEKERDKRIEELSEQSVEALRLLSKSLQTRVAYTEREAPMSKGRITESQSQENALKYDDLKEFIRRRVFGWGRPSDTAIAKVQEMALNPASEMHSEIVKVIGGNR